MMGRKDNKTALFKVCREPVGRRAQRLCLEGEKASWGRELLGPGRQEEMVQPQRTAGARLGGGERSELKEIILKSEFKSQKRP